jgi:hypothetical protein
MFWKHRRNAWVDAEAVVVAVFAEVAEEVTGAVETAALLMVVPTNHLVEAAHLLTSLRQLTKEAATWVTKIWEVKEEHRQVQFPARAVEALRTKEAHQPARYPAREAVHR